MEDTPAKPARIVRATFRGTGAKKIMLIGHMDTVYLRGMLAKQPFRIDGERAYGLGISDDKQGIALILHTVAALQALNFREYGTLTVLINPDEEISSPGARALQTRLGAEHDATLSFEASRADSDKLSLATAGIMSVNLKVTGKASHAGSAPQLGVNALYELAHQMLQTRDLSDPATGLKMNWTLARGGSNRNVIPAEAEAVADVRVLRVADYDRIEAAVRERAKKQLLPESKIELTLRAPPPSARGLARLRGPGEARAGHLQGTRHGPRRRRGGRGRRHRRRLRRAEDAERGRRALRPARLRRALQQRRVHPDPEHRAAPVPRGAADHGSRARAGYLTWKKTTS